MFPLILAVACLGSAIYVAFDVMTAPARERRNLVLRAAQYGRLRVVHGPALPKFKERALDPFITKLAKLMLRINPRMSMDVVALKLAAAGNRRLTPTSFLAVRALCGIGGFVLGLLFATSAGKSGALWLIVLPIIGFFGPSYWLTLKGRKRQELVTAELPDALDLLAVSVEAGLGFDGAVAKLTEHMQGPLIDEFELALGEMRVGEGRAAALKRIADRVPSQEMASFVRSIIQADQLGISLGRILRVQATDTRNKRQAAAEEKAMKAPIKMLFPLVLFIFPAMFIVILGPAFLNLGQLFKL